MATHCSVLAWRIPGMEEPSGLPSVGSHRVGTRLKQLSSNPDLVGDSRGQKSLVGYSPWGHKESDTT